MIIIHTNLDFVKFGFTKKKKKTYSNIRTVTSTILGNVLFKVSPHYSIISYVVELGIREDCSRTKPTHLQRYYSNYIYNRYFTLTKMLKSHGNSKRKEFGVFFFQEFR